MTPRPALAASMRRPIGLAIAVLLAVGAAGCGGGSLDASTTSLPDGARVSPQRYLADTVAAADAVADFSATLAEIGPVVRKRTLLALAPRLDAARARTSAIAGRLDAQTLEDRRIESQRAKAASALDDVVVAMTLVSDAAEAGDPSALEDAAARYTTSVGDLRSLR